MTSRAHSNAISGTQGAFVPISSVALAADTAIGVDVFLQPSVESRVVLFCSSTDAPTREHLQSLRAGGKGKLFVRRSAAEQFQAYLRKNWRSIVCDPARPIGDRVEVLSGIVREVIRDTMAKGNVSGIVAGATQLSGVICDCLTQERQFASAFYSVLHHDYSTFTHSTNVAFYAVLLARELGLPSTDFRSIATGGLLHDIGKRHLSGALLNKPGPLTHREYLDVQLHPRLGFQELVGRNDLSFGQLMMVYQHHERFDGSGYPTRMEGNAIHLWARICAVVDAYDALTCDRPYRNATPPEKAIRIMRRGADTALDGEILSCWERLIEPGKPIA